MKTIRIQFSELGDSYTPIIKYCRKLIKKGELEDSRLEVYRENEEPGIIVPHIGNLAKLRIQDTFFRPDNKYIEKMAIKAV